MGKAFGSERPRGRAKWLAAAVAAVTLAEAPAPATAATSGEARARAEQLRALNQAERPRPRIIVTSDVEIDDVASWHRFWLYANEFDIEGLVYSSSRFHWAGDPSTGVATHDWAGNDVLEQMLKGFGPFGAGGGYPAVYAALSRQGKGYPTPEELLSKVRLGNIGNVGEMAKDTPGSALIKAALLDEKPGPLWLQAWGGTNTIAAALRSIEQEYSGKPEWPSVYGRVVAKARLYIILDQDPTYKDYIAKRWPDLYTIYNRDMFWSVAYQQFRTTRTPEDLDRLYLSPDFIGRIAQGPLLQTYPRVKPPTSAPPANSAAAAAPPPRIGGFVSEGDSPAYWHLLATGLRSEESPAFGGWGGRFAAVGPHLWTDRPDALGAPGERVKDAIAGAQTKALGEAAPQTRWIPALQNDFLARSRWTYLPFEATNHEPVVRIKPTDKDISVRAGQTVTLSAEAADPDDDLLSVRWWQYEEAGSFPGKVVASPSGKTSVRGFGKFSSRVHIPATAKSGETIHIIAEVSDDDDAPLTRYARYVLTVR